MSIVLLMGVLIIALLIGVPLVFSIGISSSLYFLVFKPSLLVVMAQRIWSGTFSFIMVALPLFILAGELMNAGGLTKRLFDFCLLLLKPIRGGLGEVNVVASMLFGGISGSSVADTSALGSIEIPAMVKAGYPLGFSAGVTVASSTMGMIIPPSIPMVIFSMVSGASLGALFMAGAIPGCAIGLLQLVVVYTLSKKHNYLPERKKYEKHEFWRIIGEGLPAVLMPIFILLSISFGIVTATESAAIAVFYALLLGFLLYRELTPKFILQALKKTIVISSSIMIIIGFCTVFSWVIAVEQIPGKIATFLLSLHISRLGFLFLLDLIILVFGMFMDVSSIIIILSPILLPIGQQYGVTALQFGTIMIIGTAIGLVTPPVGMCLNVATKLCGLTITRIFKESLPWILCNFMILILVTIIPELSLWLPSLMK